MFKKNLKIGITTLVFVFLLCSTLTAQVSEQIYISGNYQEANVVNILDSLEKKYPVNFYYNPLWFNNKKITFRADNLPLNTFLSKITLGTPYHFVIIGGSKVVFLPAEQVAMRTGKMVDYSETGTQPGMTVIGNPADAGRHSKVTLSGHVLDGKTGKPLTGASLQFMNTPTGGVSGLDGGYSFTIKPGIYTLAVNSVGYESAEFSMKIIGNGNFDVELFEKSVAINEVSVFAERADRNVRSNQMSIVTMNARTIKQLPSLNGEKDIIRSFTMMPGVKSVGEFGSGINVRGGSEDQNLYLLESAPLFSTSHVFGLLSVVNPDMVSNVTLYKGHIPAEYGERVSSVMKIEINDPGISGNTVKGGIGLYNSRLMTEGNLFKGKITYKLGGRTSYSDWILTRIKDPDLRKSSAGFYDINGLLNFIFKKDRIIISGYQSSDRFTYASMLAYQYGNQLGSLTWNHIFGTQLTSSFSVNYSSYDVTRDNKQELYKKNRINAKTAYLSSEINLTYTGYNKHKLNTGIQTIRYQISPGTRTPLDTLSFSTPARLQDEQAYESAFYISDLFDITPALSLSAGLRYSLFLYTGPGWKVRYSPDQALSAITAIDSVYFNKGEIMQTWGGPEPRISLKYQLDDKSSVKLSYNRNKQYISRISYTSVSTPEDRWKLADPYIKPLTSDQWAIGYYRNFAANSIESSVEIYYKKLTNFLEYKDNARFEMNADPERALITNATGNNYGVELMLRKNKGKTEGWISYTYSRSLKQTHSKQPQEMVNQNSVYPSAYDKPHDLTVMATYHINRRWRVSANFNFASGRPVTLPEYQYSHGEEQIVYYSDRNKYRLPPYHRLDLSLSIDESLRIKKKWKGSWTFSLLNVYGRKNAYSVFYRKEQPSLSNDFKSFALYKLYIIGRPFPAITYNFIF